MKSTTSQESRRFTVATSPRRTDFAGQTLGGPNGRRSVGGPKYRGAKLIAIWAGLLILSWGWVIGIGYFAYRHFVPAVLP